jgi:hypothetical protein
LIHPVFIIMHQATSNRAFGGSRARISTLVLGLALSFVSSEARAGLSEETVFFDLPEALETDPLPVPSVALAALPGYPDDPGRLTLAARLFLPDEGLHGAGPYPAVIILHGSGGLWSNDIIANGLISQFEQWGELLAGMGYAAIFPDSYNPRGIPANFGGRRPHYNPELDDAVCSPNYERPKDVLATLAYLQTRPDIDPGRIALIGFSHGAQTAMNALVDPSVDLGQYQVDYIDLDEKDNDNPVDDEEVSTTLDVPGPVRIGDELPFPVLGVFYYGGGSHYGYHGSASDTGPGRFMFDRRTKVLLFHGTEDSLMGVDDTDATPMTGNLYPLKQVLASSAQAAVEGVADPLQHHFIFEKVGHSFDLVTAAPEVDWNTPDENPNQKAKRLARVEVLKYFETYLKAPPAITIAAHTPGQDEVHLSVDSTSTHVRYQWRSSVSLGDWQPAGLFFDGSGGAEQRVFAIGALKRRFFLVEREPVPPPFDDPNHAGFFRTYDDFSF